MTRATKLPDAIGWTWPAATAVVALTADLLPLQPGPAPLASLCLVYAWAVRAPERLPLPAVFLLALTLDGVAGTPLGLTALPLLLGYAAARALRRRLLAAPFAAVWAAFAPVALLGCGVRWLVASVWWWHLFSVQMMLAEAFLTVAAYPLLGWPVWHLTPGQRAVRDAAGR